MKTERFRVVLDTTVVLAYVQTKSDDSPNREIIRRWARREFDVLWTRDVLNEYIDKMREFGISEDKIIKFISQFVRFGEVVKIEFFHYESYPEDAKDICFVLCALNGHGTHIVTYDRHLLDLAHEYSQRFSISVLKPVPFLKKLREFLNE
ncbi:PIN domain-containing protein [Candidatus Poribacteria bacterium]|nr:PIN domain-containing protein [Candidatus Poribacteria bacterium]